MVGPDQLVLISASSVNARAAAAPRGALHLSYKRRRRFESPQSIRNRGSDGLRGPKFSRRAGSLRRCPPALERRLKPYGRRRRFLFTCSSTSRSADTQVGKEFVLLSALCAFALHVKVERDEAKAERYRLTQQLNRNIRTCSRGCTALWRCPGRPPLGRAAPRGRRLSPRLAQTYT